MNINELFEIIQDEFASEDLNGEFLLHGNVIIWSYNLTEDNEELTFINEDDEEETFSFEANSSEELLLEAYREDFNKLQEFLDNIDETDNWSFSDSEIVDDVIIFKIF
jgi:hypothetical protein